MGEEEGRRGGGEQACSWMLVTMEETSEKNEISSATPVVPAPKKSIADTATCHHTLSSLLRPRSSGTAHRGLKRGGP